MGKTIEPIDDGNCRALWMAVIAQQVIDARSTCSNTDYQRRRQAALDWLADTDPNSDFYNACDLADLDREYVSMRVRFYLNNPDEKIDFRTARKTPCADESYLKEDDEDDTAFCNWALVTTVFCPAKYMR